MNTGARKLSRRQAGVGGLILLLVIVGGSVIGWRSRTADGQQIPAFHVGEAGVDYFLHVLNSGSCTPDELLAQQPIVHTVPEAATNVPIGFFVATFARDAEKPGSWRLLVVGHDATTGRVCEKIEATLESFSGVLGTKYRALDWDSSAVGCGETVAERPLVCKGIPEA